MIVAIKIAVDAILEVAVINPYVIARLKRQIVVAIDVVGSGTLEGHVAHDEVFAPLDEHNACFCFLFAIVVDESRAGQPIDGQILRILHIDIFVCFNSALHVDSNLCRSIVFGVVVGCLQRGGELVKCGHHDGVDIVAASCHAVNRCPSDRRSRVVRRQIVGGKC